MRTVARRARMFVVLSLSLAAGVAALAGQGRAGGGGGVVFGQTPGEAAPKGTGLLLGQVVDGTSGRPVGGVIVTLTSTASAANQQAIEAGVMSPAAAAAPRQILTDADGRFLFRELAHGRYTLRASAPGYLAGGLGQTRATGTGQTVDLATDDEKKGDLVVRIWKSASLNGTVLDEIGEPVPGLYMRALRRTMTGGTARFSSAGSASTDDRGMYRMSGLTPGDYLIGVFTTQSVMPIATTEAYLQLMTNGTSPLNSDLYRELSSSGVSPMMGGYRVGDYVISNSGRGFMSGGPPVPLEENRILTYPTQFYSAAATASHATLITLGSGEDRNGIDLQLKLASTVKVSGVVTGPDGPVRNLGIKLMPPEADAFTSDSGLENAATVTDASGAFTFLGVVPGQYVLKVIRVPRPITASSSSSMTMIEVNGPNGMIMGMGSSGGVSTAPPPALPTDPTLWATVPLAIAETDLSGLTVTLRPGIRINGHIEFDGTKDKPTPDQLQRASLSFTPVSGVSSSPVATAAKRVERDGRFSTVGFPPGRYLVSASLAAAAATAGAPAGWTFRNAALGGRDVSNEGLDLTGEDVADLVITFTDQTTDLTGQVTDARSQPDKTALVIVFPADTDSWKNGVMNARRLRSSRTSTTGAYSFSGLPAGAYYVAAVPDATVTEWQDPKLLESLAQVATRVTIRDGDKKTQDLSTRTVR